MADLPQDDTSTRMAPTNNDLGNALEGFMNGSGDQSSVQTTENADFIQKMSHTTDLESLQDAASNEPKVDPKPEDVVSPEPAVEDVDDTEYLELKVKGRKEPVKVPKNWDDEKVQEYLNKGARFDTKMSELAQIQKDLQAERERLKDYDSKAEVASRVEQAQKLAAEGYREHALRVLLGDQAEEYIDAITSEREEYKNADPMRRLEIEKERAERDKTLRTKQAEDKIAELEARLNARSEEVQEAEYTGYIEDAKSRYDLSQWVEDSDHASDLNDMLEASAMREIQRLQRQREADGRENITQRDIRRAFATRAKRLVANIEGQSSKKADAKVSQTAETAKKNAQVASTKAYADGSNPLADWSKKGGSMADLVNAMRRPGSLL